MGSRKRSRSGRRSHHFPGPSSRKSSSSSCSSSSNDNIRSASRRSSRQQYFNSSVATTSNEQIQLSVKTIPAPPPRPCYNMVIQAPKDYKDDVSDATFSMGSVSSPPRPVMHSEATVEKKMEKRFRLHEYDEKGQWVRHPFIKLRKKNVLQQMESPVECLPRVLCR